MNLEETRTFDYLQRKILEAGNIVNLIQHQHGVLPDMENISLDDSKVYSLLADGETDGVYILETLEAKEIISQFKPTSFSDLMTVLALMQGILQARPGLLQLLIDRKQDPFRIRMVHKELEPVLKETYGVVLYREQVLEVIRFVAGLEETDAEEMLANLKNSYADSSNTLKPVEEMTDIEERFHSLYELTRYQIPRSEAEAMAQLAYKMAYLKAYYPFEFISVINKP